MLGSLMFRAVNQLETIDWLVRTLDAKEPFAALTGDVGVGKSTVAAAAAARLSEHGYLVIQAAPPFASPLQLQQLLAERLGLQTGPRITPAAIAAALRDRRPPPGAPAAAVLLIDGAELLPPTVLQYIWLMHRLGGLRTPRLQIVFVGRFAFWEQFTGPELSELQADIAARSVVLPLPGDEALAYMQYRLVSVGAPEPATIPRRLAKEILALGQGIPLRLNLIADSVLAREPNTARVTSRGIQAAAAELAGASVVARVPATLQVRAKLSGRQRLPLAVGAVAVLAAVGAGALLLVPQDATPSRIAAAKPRVASPVQAEPAPTRLPVAAAHPEPEPGLVAPVVMAIRPDTPPAPPARPLVAGPVAATQPILVLPDAAMPRISLLYTATDPGAAARAQAWAARLRERGFLVGAPSAAPGASRTTTVEYFFIEDRNRAVQLARDLGGIAGIGRIASLPDPALPPPPGTLRVVLSDQTVPAQ